MMDFTWAELLPTCAKWRTLPLPETPSPSPAAHGSRGEPLWPVNVVGSVTHAGGYRTIAVAPASQVAVLGIDMEVLAPLPPAIWPHVFNAAELAELLDLPVPQRGFAALSRWCLKEALFKAVQGSIPLDALPLTGAGGALRPAPELQAALKQQGIHAPEHLVLRSTASSGWLCAAAWIIHPTLH